MTTLYIATMETAHYSFKGVGETRTEAKTALTAALTEHGVSCELKPHWWQGFSQHCTKYTAGDGLLDGVKIASVKGKKV